MFAPFHRSSETVNVPDADCHGLTRHVSVYIAQMR